MSIYVWGMQLIHAFSLVYEVACVTTIVLLHTVIQCQEYQLFGIFAAIAFTVVQF